MGEVWSRQAAESAMGREFEEGADAGLAARRWWRWHNRLAVKVVTSDGWKIMTYNDAFRKGVVLQPDPADPFLPGWLLYLLRGRHPGARVDPPTDPGTWAVFLPQPPPRACRVFTGLTEIAALVAALDATVQP